MAENPWYPFYVGDYQQKTSHLSMAEHGAYRLLLDHYYATGHPLPADHKILYRICRVSELKDRRIIDKILSEFFINAGTEYHHEKCDFEIAKRLKYSESQSAKAHLRHSRGHMPKDMPRLMPEACPEPARAPVPQPHPQKESKIGGDGNAGARDGAFQKIHRRILEHFPHLALKEASVIHAWLAEADPDLDILPVIDLVNQKNGKPETFGYFSKAIARSREQRLNPLPTTPDAKGKPHGKHSGFDKQDYRAGTDGFIVVGGD